MMTNLFSIFDPSTYYHIQLNWLSALLFMLLFPMNYWILPSNLMIMLNKFNLYLFYETKNLFKNWSLMNLNLFISLMIMILINNFMGLFPYIFTSSSHLIMPLSLSLSMWIGIMMFNLINFNEFTLAHFTPLGTPKILMMFMVLIEFISNTIRPFTLAIRLTANMIAGHLLLTLLGSTGEFINLIILMFMIFIQSLLMILEMAVAMIQSYVFSILSILYSNEIYESF